MSAEQIKGLSKEELKSKSENLILLYEYLVRLDQRRNQKNFTKDNRDFTISD